jgi:molybdopterin converting factor small subunit
MEVRLFATLRENHGSVVDIQWYEGLDAQALLGALGFAPEDVSMFLINGMNSKLDSKIKADDIIALFPPLGGG